MQPSISTFDQYIQRKNSSSIDEPINEAAQVVDYSKIEAIARMKAISIQSLLSKGFCYRHDWGDLCGRWKLTLKWIAITPRSKVLAAFVENNDEGSNFAGTAKYTVQQITPADGSATIMVNLKKNTPTRLYVDYFVCG
ncbi:MAG: hypothetical protein IPI97_01335 [Nitrosomonas sp.]|nr:hypothetical protein [Nitrosomonas sp.]